MPIESMKKEYHEYCPISKSNNIVFCPEKINNRRKDKKTSMEQRLIKKRRCKKKKSKSNTNEKVNEIKEKGLEIKENKKDKAKRERQS